MAECSKKMMHAGYAAQIAKRHKENNERWDLFSWRSFALFAAGQDLSDLGFGNIWIWNVLTWY
jgi:hypothetical protein